MYFTYYLQINTPSDIPIFFKYSLILSIHFNEIIIINLILFISIFFYSGPDNGRPPSMVSIKNFSELNANCQFLQRKMFQGAYFSHKNMVWYFSLDIPCYSKQRD